MAQQRVGLGLAAAELAEHLCRVHTAAEGEDSVAEAPPDATHLHAPRDAGAPRSMYYEGQDCFYVSRTASSSSSPASSNDANASAERTSAHLYE